MLGRIGKAITISRPISWIVAPLAYAIGLYAAPHGFGWLEAVEMILISFPASFLVYGMNDIYDIRTDSANPRKGSSVWGGVLGEGDAGWVKKSSLLVALLIMAAALSSGNVAHVAAALVSVLAAYAYSAPPLRLKAVPIADSLVSALYSLGPFAMGYSLSGGFGFLQPQFVLFSLTFSALHALAAIMDMEDDRKAGIRTFATAFGPRLPAVFAALIFAANVPFSLAVMKSAGIPIAVFAALSAYAAIFPSPENAKKAWSAMLAIFFLWLFYALLAVGTGFEGINLPIG